MEGEREGEIDFTNYTGYCRLTVVQNTHLERKTTFRQ